MAVRTLGVPFVLVRGGVSLTDTSECVSYLPCRSICSPVVQHISLDKVNVCTHGVYIYSHSVGFTLR